MGLESIAIEDRPVAEELDHAVVLLFTPGSRPTASAIQALSLAHGQFAVTLESGAGDAGRQWVELLANGLTFDLSGIAPGPGLSVGSEGHLFGLEEGFDASKLEGVSLLPGPHLTSGGPMVPVLRCLAWLAAELAQLEGLRAIMWRPAHTICEPGYFHDVVTKWIGGGPFPGLGLTALVPHGEGAMASEGLALFTGQELVIDPDIAVDRSYAAKLAVRLLHWLVENGRVDTTMSLTGPSGETLILEPQPKRGIVCVWRGSR